MQLGQFKIYFLGIGGVGMCGLAELLHNLGATVWGSDLALNANTEHLQSLGVEVFIGHARGQIRDADVVVYSSAIPNENVEIQEAREKQIPIIPRAEVLAEIMRLRRGIAVGGSHGKTTTTSLIASVMIEGKQQPTIVVGGRLDVIKSTALLGQGQWLVAEADESDGSFLKLNPELVVITNIDNDHMDFYKSDAELEEAFRDFALKVPFYGKVFACGDDKRMRQALANFPKKLAFYGFDESNDYRLVGQNGQYTLVHDGKVLGAFEMSFPGRHYALNATAALLVGLEVGLDFATCAKGLFAFTGVGRRFQLKGNLGTIPVYDDYAHHPTEIRATLSAFREKYPTSRIVLAFQPHRYSRTELVWSEFLNCFTQADQLYICDIYAAGEKPLTNITAERLVREIDHKQKSYIGKWQDSVSQIKSQLKEGDIFVTFGAGDIWKLGMELTRGS